MTTKHIKYLFCFIISLLGIALHSCSLSPDDPGDRKGNEAPSIMLSNIPPDDPDGNNLLDPEITIHWYGEDSDGYIEHYKYRLGRIRSQKDTLWQAWISIKAIDSNGDRISGSNKAQFIVNSPDERNFHIFEITATDNLGRPSSASARVRFWTKKGPMPETILTSSPGSEAIAPDVKTESWSGLIFHFSDTESGYSYKINDGLWSGFSDTNMIVLTGKDFPKSGYNKIFFKAKNRYAVEDETALQFDITIIRPTKTKRILLIDMTSNGIGLPGSPTDEEVDGFYEAIINKNGIKDFQFWDVKAQGGFPDKSIIADFKMLFIYSDNSYTEMENKLFAHNILSLEEYLNTGGRLFISGWKVTNLFFNSEQAGNFFFKYSQVNRNPLISIEDLEMKTKNLMGYPVLTPQLSKFPIQWNQKLADMEFFTPRGFCEEIYTMNLPMNTYNGKTAVSILKTNTYKTALSSLPLFYFNTDDVALFLKKMMEDLN